MALFSQEADLTCKEMVVVVGGEIKALIDTGASISMIRSQDHFQLGFRENKLEVMKLKIFQVDRREIRYQE